MSELSAESLIPFRVAGVVTAEWLREYARVSGDFNPIHQDEGVARAAGLPGIIAHGMLLSSLLHSRACEAVVEYRNLRGFRIRGSRTRFRAMTFVGDEVWIGGQWASTGADEIRLELQARKPSGETTVTATFELARTVAAAPVVTGGTAGGRHGATE